MLFGENYFESDEIDYLYFLEGITIVSVTHLIEERFVFSACSPKTA